MKSAILTVGTEILFGQIVNTNAAFLSRNLNDLGIDVMYHNTVGDNPQRLRKVLENLLEECDLVITTGGLGPTQDDLTKEIVAEITGDRLMLHQPSMDRIEEYFRLSGREMTENNIRQAYVPEKSRVLPNDRGSAPGFVSERDDGKAVMCLPGPPWEMEHMFTKYGIMYLKEKSDEAICYRFVRTAGIGESILETRLIDLIDGQVDPTIATYCSEGESYLRITSKRKSEDEATEAVEEMVDEVYRRVGDYIYCTGEKTLPEVLGDVMKQKGLTLASAESCTGGLFADSHISVPGSSGYFVTGIVTYSEESKMKYLGVKKETLEKYTAVSSQVAVEMVEGLARETGCDICAAVTGLCGPGKDQHGRDPGLVYTAVKYGGRVMCLENRFRDSGRNLLRKRSAGVMNKMIFDMLREEYPEMFRRSGGDR